MNCPNCGAVVKGSVCEYCGTTFENKEINVHIEMKGDTEELVKAFRKIGGNYMLDCYRDADGRLHRGRSAFV